MLKSFLLSSLSGRVHWKPAPKPEKLGSVSSPSLSGLIRRSVSCPRSISSLSGQSPSSDGRGTSNKSLPQMGSTSVASAHAGVLAPPTSLVRPHTALRSHSLSRNISAHRMPHSSSLGTIHSTMASVKYTHVCLPKTNYINSYLIQCHQLQS